MGRPLLLGEAPSRAGDRFYMVPLSGNPAVRICRIMGWDTGGEAAYWTLVEHFETLNTIRRFADAEPWSAVRARERWNTHLRERRRSDRSDLVVVCLGRRAAAAVGIGAWEVGDWVKVPGGVEAVAAPHTSGRSRLWNDPETEFTMRRVLAEEEARERPEPIGLRVLWESTG